MVIGRMEVRLRIPSARSLKDKRRQIKSLIDRIHKKHNASVAEVGENDIHQMALLGVAVVSNQRDHADRRMASIIEMINRERELILIDYETEVI